MNARSGEKVDTIPDMDHLQFTQWAQLLEERTGMSLPVERRSFLVTNLRMRMRDVGFNSFQKYYDFIQDVSAASAVEWEHLVDKLTVHETRFYRHAHSIDYISAQFLPEKIGVDHASKIHVWSVGCSTGEEAYTLAMVLSHYFQGRGTKASWAVTGTDISLPSLNEARKGIYHRRKLVELDGQLIRQYFTEVDENRVQVKDELRQRVCFAQLNVNQIQQSPLRDMDVVFCQNLLIYFDKQHRDQIVLGMVDRVAAGGLIVLGPGEMLGWTHPQLEKVTHPNVLAYRKKGSRVSV